MPVPKRDDELLAPPTASMPPKASSQPKVPDIKARKITDFWGKSDAGSSPQLSRQASSQLTPASSPIRKTSTNTSTPVPKLKPGGSLFPGGLTTVCGPAGLNVGSSTNILQPNPSPRKFIVISSDDDDTDQDSKMSVSKKRPRESAPPDPAAIQSPQATSQSKPETSTRDTIDLTYSPPRKKRVIEAVASGSHSRTASSVLSASSSHPEFSPVTPPSPQDSHSISLDAAVASNGGSMSDVSLALGTTAPFSSTGTSLESSLSAPDLSAPKPQHPQDKARSRIEEIRRLAEAKQQADRVQTTKVYHPMVIDDSEDEEEDPLEKLIPTKKIPPTSKPKSKPASTRRKRAGSPLPANIFDAMSPLTEPDSDDQSVDEPSARSNLPNVTTRSRSRAASQAPEIPPPTRTRTRANSKAPILPPPPRSPASSKPPTIPAPASRLKKLPAKVVPAPAPSTSAIPSSLASLLEESPSAYRRPDDAKTREFMQVVKQDMLNIEQRHLYGDVMASEPLENSRRIDPSVTEMALGEEDGRKMNEVLASDNSTATQISPWRPFWDEQLVGARDVSMDIDYQIPPLFLSNSSHPVLAHLQKLVANKDNTHLGLFLSSGILSATPPNTEDGSLVPWLFMLACEAPDHVANAAQQSLRERFSTQAKFNLDCHQLVLSRLVDPILSLGPLAEAIAPLRRSTAAISPPRDPITRSVVVSRLVSIIRMTSKDMVPQNPEDVILLLLLLYLDPSTPSDVRRDISLVIEDILVSITSHPDDSQRMKALVVCKKIIEITANFRVVEKRMLLDCIFGGQPSPRNFMRWVAVGFLLPEAVQALGWTEYLKPPPLGPFALMLTPGHMSTSPFRIWPKTDYHDLHNRTDILGTILTDIGLYGAKEDRNLERIIAGLLNIHSKIVDARAAFIERTRAKDALQRLRLRVHFQFERTTKPTKATTTIDNMLKR